MVRYHSSQTYCPVRWIQLLPVDEGNGANSFL